jgi:hypothetical protein
VSVCRKTVEHWVLGLGRWDGNSKEKSEWVSERKTWED